MDKKMNEAKEYEKKFLQVKEKLDKAEGIKKKEFEDIVRKSQKELFEAEEKAKKDRNES